MYSNNWIKLQSELLYGEYEARTLLNPYTNDIYIIGGHSQNTAIDIQIFSQTTETIKSSMHIGAIGGSSNEIYNDLLLIIGRHNTLTQSYDTIQYTFIPNTPNIDLTANECHTFIEGQKQDEVCWTFDIDLNSKQ